MNNLPLFTKRYAPDLIPSSPEYVDILILILLVTFSISALLWGISRSRRNANKGIIPLVLTVYCSLQTLLLIGLSYATARGSTDTFWHDMGSGLLVGTAYLVLSTIFYFISWHIFTSDSHLEQWFISYFQLWGLLGLALYVPVILSLATPTNNPLSITLLIVLYILYRLGIIATSIGNFPKLTRHPLHIILYLCTCEIAPLLFLFA